MNQIRKCRMTSYGLEKKQSTRHLKPSQTSPLSTACLATLITRQCYALATSSFARHGGPSERSKGNRFLEGLDECNDTRSKGTLTEDLRQPAGASVARNEASGFPTIMRSTGSIWNMYRNTWLKYTLDEEINPPSPRRIQRERMGYLSSATDADLMSTS
jgi:hypothetical protein